MLENDKHFDMLALYLVWFADGRCFRNSRVTDQARLNFHRAEPVTADFDHVIHAALNAYIAVIVHMSSITGKVDTFDGIPVGLVTGGVSEDRAHLGRPGMAYDQEASFAWRN